MSTKTESDWYKFEQAVATFLEALDHSAHIIHDVQIPDKDTGSLRQRDVWIESSVAGFPIRILVSCKYYNKKLSQQDIDAFIGELRSSGANKGVIYSKHGFYEDAIKKAKINEIACCILLQDANPSELIPDKLTIPVYARRGRISCNATGLDFKLNVSLFLKSKNRRTGRRMWLDIADATKRMIHENDNEQMSTVLRAASSISPRPVELQINYTWVYYRAEVEALLVSGSYNFSDNLFKGTITSPMIDRMNPDLGVGWTRLEAKPEQSPAQILMSLG